MWGGGAGSLTYSYSRAWVPQRFASYQVSHL